MAVAEDSDLATGAPLRAVAGRRSRALVLMAGLAVLACVGGGLWLGGHLRHPTVFSDFGYGAGATVTAGTTVTFPLTPDPWDSNHGTLHVHAITPGSVEDTTAGASLTVWRCSHTKVGAPDGPALGEASIARVCEGAERVSGPFDLEASRGSREALLLAVTSPTPGLVRFSGVHIDYRDGVRSGGQVINVDGDVHFRDRRP